MFVLKPIVIGHCDQSKLLSTRLGSSLQDMFIHYQLFFYGTGISSNIIYLLGVISPLLKFYFEDLAFSSISVPQKELS